MTTFEKVTTSPEALGELLDSLTLINSPWDAEFHKAFCRTCGRDDCENCPHEKERNNPLWWLNQAVESEQETMGIAQASETGVCQDADETAGLSEREWLIREYERRLALLKSGARRNGQAALGPGTIVQLPKEEPPANGVYDEFNVYLNGKGQNGKILPNIKRVILPTVSAYKNGRLEPMGMKLVFGGCEDAAEIIKLLGKKCKLEVRAAVSNWKNGQVEFHGHSYILEAEPFKIEPKPLKRRAGMELAVFLLVYRYTATVGEAELWDFECWGYEA